MRRQPRPEAAPEVKAAALALLEANGGNLKRTAQELGMSRSTLRSWAGRMTQRSRAVLHKDTPREVVDELAGKWKRLADRSVDVALQAMEALTPEQIQQIKPKDIRELAVTGAVATEKNQLLTGKPTDRVEVQDLASFLKGSTQSGTTTAPKPAPTALDVPTTYKH